MLLFFDNIVRSSILYGHSCKPILYCISVMETIFYCVGLYAVEN